MNVCDLKWACWQRLSHQLCVKLGFLHDSVIFKTRTYCNYRIIKIGKDLLKSSPAFYPIPLWPLNHVSKCQIYLHVWPHRRCFESKIVDDVRGDSYLLQVLSPWSEKELVCVRRFCACSNPAVNANHSIPFSSQRRVFECRTLLMAAYLRVSRWHGGLLLGYQCGGYRKKTDVKWCSKEELMTNFQSESASVLVSVVGYTITATINIF